MNRAHPAPGRPRPADAVLAAIDFLLLDVDGVLTDGRVWFGPDGHEYKAFHVHDAAGMFAWHKAGGLTGFLSGRAGETVERRAKELGVVEVMLRRTDKGPAFDELLQRRGLDPMRVAYVGDDLVDLPVLRRVGFAVTVPDARDEVFAAAHHVTTRRGGEGAVRDVIEQLLHARGAWRTVVNRYETP